jgi:hypothetical protein
VRGGWGQHHTLVLAPPASEAGASPSSLPPQTSTSPCTSDATEHTILKPHDQRPPLYNATRTFSAWGCCNGQDVLVAARETEADHQRGLTQDEGAHKRLGEGPLCVRFRLRQRGATLLCERQGISADGLPGTRPRQGLIY